MSYNEPVYMYEEQDEIFIKQFKELSSRIHKLAISKGWWKTPRNNGEIIAIIHSEISKALEGLRESSTDKHLPEFLSVEVALADAIIGIMDMASARNYRVAEALISKHTFNKSMEYMLGWTLS